MALLKRLLNKFTGLHYPQEYLSLAIESFQNPLNVYLVDGHRIIKDITNEHLFTGYSPLIFSFNSKNFSPSLPANIEIIFTGYYHEPNDSFKKKDAIAYLSLELSGKQDAGDTVIFHYKGMKAGHHFLSQFHQYIIGLQNNIYNKKPGNVFLPGNLYTQIQVAYAVPRIISLITVSDGSLFNLFPTDLHGPVNDQYYISSLRHDGKACRQVEAADRILISQVHSEAYKIAFPLGKNHMQELKPKERFPFGESYSENFQLPLSQYVMKYHELELEGSYVIGIHKLLVYKVISKKDVSNGISTLAHVHNCYATWRYNKGLAGNYLLR